MRNGCHRNFITMFILPRKERMRNRYHCWWRYQRQRKRSCTLITGRKEGNRGYCTTVTMASGPSVSLLSIYMHLYYFYLSTGQWCGEQPVVLCYSSWTWGRDNNEVIGVCSHTQSQSYFHSELCWECAEC